MRRQQRKRTIGVRLIPEPGSARAAEFVALAEAQPGIIVAKECASVQGMKVYVTESRSSLTESGSWLELRLALDEGTTSEDIRKAIPNLVILRDYLSGFQGPLPLPPWEDDNDLTALIWAHDHDGLTWTEIARTHLRDPGPLSPTGEPRKEVVLKLKLDCLNWKRTKRFRLEQAAYRRNAPNPPPEESREDDST